MSDILYVRGQPSNDRLHALYEASLQVEDLKDAEWTYHQTPGPDARGLLVVSITKAGPQGMKETHAALKSLFEQQGFKTGLG